LEQELEIASIPTLTQEIGLTVQVSVYFNTTIFAGQQHDIIYCTMAMSGSANQWLQISEQTHQVNFTD